MQNPKVRVFGDARSDPLEVLQRGGNLKRDAPETRVKNQTRGTPEEPIIALLLRTDLHDTLESVIQGILTLQGKHLPNAQGREMVSYKSE